MVTVTSSCTTRKGGPPVRWQLTDTIAAVFFSFWLLSFLGRPFAAGIDILVGVVAIIWIFSVWAKKNYRGQDIPVTEPAPEPEEQSMAHEMICSPKYSGLPGNIHTLDDQRISPNTQ